MRFHHQHEHPAHQHYHRASSAEQANRNTRPDDTARKKEPQPRSRGTRAGRRHRQKQTPQQRHPHQDTRNTGYDTRLTQQPVTHRPVTYQPVTQKHHYSVDTLAEQIAEQVTSQLRPTLHESYERLKLRNQQAMSELRLTLQKQRDDIGNSFRQILFGKTRKSSYNTVSNMDNDDVDENDSERETDYTDESDDEDVEEPYPSLRCSSASSSSSSIYKRSDSSNTTGVAPVSLPSLCSQIEEIKDPFVKALTKHQSLTQLHEWLKSIKSSVNNSIASATMVASHFTTQPTSQLTVIELLLKSVSIQLNHSPLAWSGFAKYENFKPWKTKQSFHPRHPHCWFAPSPQPTSAATDCATSLALNPFRRRSARPRLIIGECVNRLNSVDLPVAIPFSIFPSATRLLHLHYSTTTHAFYFTNVSGATYTHSLAPRPLSILVVRTSPPPTP